MPRVDPESESSGASPRSSPVFAKPANETPQTTTLDETGDGPQGATNEARAIPTRQGDVSSLSDKIMHSDFSLSASPPSTTAPTSEKLEADIASITKLLQAASSQAAGRVLRTFWRKFLFSENDDDHLCWILRAGIKNAPASVIERVLKDQTILNIMVPLASKMEPVIQAVLSGTTYDQLLNHMPEAVLDREVCQRLKTMPAKPLIRWLAEAERLGFREDDILDDEDESVMPNPSILESDMPRSVLPVSALLDSFPPKPITEVSAAGYMSSDDSSKPGSKDVEMVDIGHSMYSLPGREQRGAVIHPPPPAVSATPKSTSSLPLTCPVCRFVFTSSSGYNYHMTKRFCASSPPPGGYKWLCKNCGRGFTTKQGMNYHVDLKKVCFEDGIAPATSPSGQPQQQQTSANPIPPQHKPHDAILPPPRPTFSTFQRQQGQNGSFQTPPTSQASKQAHSHPLTSAAIPQPPLQTPISNQSRPSGIHVNPPARTQPVSSSQPRMSPSELSPLRLAQLNQALAEQEAKYQAQCAAVDPTLGAQKRAARLQSLKNGHATKKSQIRKSFNVSLRIGEKEKSARNVAMATPGARPSFEEYSATPTSRGPPYMDEAVPVRSSPLTAALSHFSPINAPRPNEHSRQEKQSMPHGAHAFSSPVNGRAPVIGNGTSARKPESIASPYVDAHKPQRTNNGDSPSHTSPDLPKRAHGQSSAVGMGDEAPLPASGSVETSNNESGHPAAKKVPSNPADTVLASTEHGAAANAAKNKTYYIDISSSEDSIAENLPAQRRKSPPASTSRIASSTYQYATNGTERRSLEKRGSEGPARGTFTAKRGRH